MAYAALYVPAGEPKLPRSILDGPPLDRYIANFGADTYDQCLIAVADGRMIGAAWGRRYRADRPGYGFISEDIPELSIAIREGRRGGGIGTKLLEGIMAVYREMGVAAVSLSVDQRNPAVKLYRKLGFEIVEQNEKSYVMRRELVGG